MEKKSENLRKALHEPIAPYFADTYNTLLSIVQGLALGALIYFIFDEDKLNLLRKFNLLTALKGIITFWVICLIWHRYVTHTQYIAWRLSFIDTLIPMVFAITQFWLILAVAETTFCFFLAFMWVSLVGVIAYMNALRQFKGDELKNLLLERLRDESFVAEFFTQLKSYENESVISMIVIFIIVVLVIAANYSINCLNEEIKTYCTMGIFSLILLTLTKYDLTHKLRRSQKLNGYFE